MKSNHWSIDLLKLVFHNESAKGIGTSDGIPGTATAGNLFLSLHTSDPGQSGLQKTNEATFKGYTRIPVPRGTKHWKVDLVDLEIGPAKATNMDRIAWKECKGGTNTITHVGVGTSSNGDGKLLYSGKLVESRTVSPGIILIMESEQLALTED